VRVNFNYFIPEEVFRFLVEAVHVIANDGYRLLPEYTFEPVSGLWEHRSGLVEPPLSLNDISYQNGEMSYATHQKTEPLSRLADYLTLAEQFFQASHPSREEIGTLPRTEHFETLRWFWLPEEIAG
jgi:hypothetical protein